MHLHANAALGLAGRRRLVGLIEQGHSPQGRRGGPRRRPGDRPPLVAPLAGAERAPARRAAPALPTARADPTARPGGCGRDQEAPILRRPRTRPTWARDAWPGSPAGPARRSGRCSRRHGRSRRAPRPAAAHPPLRVGRPGALIHIDTARLARFRPPRAPHPRTRRAPAQPTAPARSSSTSPSTITAATPTSSSTPTSERRTCAAFVRRALAHFAELGPGAGRGGDDRRGRCLPAARAPSQQALARARRAPHPHPALHPALERQGRALHPDPQGASGPTRTSGPHRPPARGPSPAGSGPTIGADSTARSVTGRRSAAFTTSVGRTPSPR